MKTVFGVVLDLFTRYRRRKQLVASDEEERTKKKKRGVGYLKEKGKRERGDTTQHRTNRGNRDWETLKKSSRPAKSVQRTLSVFTSHLSLCPVMSKDHAEATLAGSQ
jgi:hypothetical protein